MIKRNAAEGVFVSICAMGAEFNASLTETVTKNKGSNYWCATSEAQLRESLVDDFAFNMFPATFAVDLSVRSSGFDVAAVYGTPFDTKEVEDLLTRWEPATAPRYSELTRHAATQLLLYSHSQRTPLPAELIGKVVDTIETPKCSITEVNTMFPSRLELDGAMKGGLILLKLHRKSSDDADAALEVTVEYEDTAGNLFSHTDSVDFPSRGSPTSSTNDSRMRSAVDKGVLLQRYVEVCREFMKLDKIAPIWVGQQPVEREGAGEPAVTPIKELPRLRAELADFKDRVARFYETDERMQEATKTFTDFVGVFEKRHAPPEDAEDCPAASH